MMYGDVVIEWYSSHLLRRLHLLTATAAALTATVAVAADVGRKPWQTRFPGCPTKTSAAEGISHPPTQGVTCNSVTQNTSGAAAKALVQQQAGFYQVPGRMTPDRTILHYIAFTLYTLDREPLVVSHPSVSLFSNQSF